MKTHETDTPRERASLPIRVFRWLWFRRWVGFVVLVGLVLLTVINLASRGTVDRQEEDARNLICARVMPEATAFSETPYSHELAQSIYAGYDGSTLKGYCVQVRVNGFGGVMTLMVGVDTDGKVTGVAIESHNEEPDWAEQADSTEHTQQYIGRSGTIRYGSITGVTGATTTSKAMTDGVNQALKVIAETDMKGGSSLVETIED